MASLKVKVTIQTYAMWIDYNENMFVSYLFSMFDCKRNVSHIDLHAPCMLLYKFTIIMDLQLSNKIQYLNQGTILLKALGRGIRVLWTHI